MALCKRFRKKKPVSDYPILNYYKNNLKDRLQNHEDYSKYYSSSSAGPFSSTYPSR